MGEPEFSKAVSESGSILYSFRIAMVLRLSPKALKQGNDWGNRCNISNRGQLKTPVSTFPFKTYDKHRVILFLCTSYSRWLLWGTLRGIATNSVWYATNTVNCKMDKWRDPSVKTNLVKLLNHYDVIFNFSMTYFYFHISLLSLLTQSSDSRHSSSDVSCRGLFFNSGQV